MKIIRTISKVFKLISVLINFNKGRIREILPIFRVTHMRGL